MTLLVLGTRQSTFPFLHSSSGQGRFELQGHPQIKLTHLT